MASKGKMEQVVLLPSRGLTARVANPESADFFHALNSEVGRGMIASGGPSMRVLDSIHPDGAKLVEIAPDDLVSLRAAQPGFRMVPVVYYRHLMHRAMLEQVVTTASSGKISLRVVGPGNKPIPGVQVAAFVDFESRRGAGGVTDAKGRVALKLPSGKVERLYLYPPSGYWPGLRTNIKLAASTDVELTPIDLSYVDCVRHFYGNSTLQDGQGVKVGVIDSGVATNHPDLQLAGGRNTVTGEAPTDFGDNGGEGHGTHVAGIIAGRGSPPTGVRGVAPGVTLMSYRVFGKKGGGASNFAIAKAIDAAVSDGCDVLNMSLGGGNPDPLTQEAIAAARAAGTIVLAANGNDERAPVSFPASDDLCLAVSAMGHKGTFPSDSEPAGSVAKPYGKDKKDFVAEFSNIGADTDITGPGVGVISSVPKGYGVMSGTSMACPAATGAAARLLARAPNLLAMPRNQARSDAMVKAVYIAARALGFGPTFEGKGLVLP
jgi:subtilisin